MYRVGVCVCVCVCVVLSTEADRRLYLTHDNVPDRRRPLVHQPVARLLFFYVLHSRRLETARFSNNFSYSFRTIHEH